MPVPNTFGTATSAIPLSQLDANFAAPITIGNTAVQLGNTVTTLNNMTLANVTISSGTITITNVAVTTANVSGTANISTLVVVGNETVGGNTTITGNITAANANVTTNLVLSGGTANGVAYLNTSKVLTTGSALVFDGTNLGLGVTPTAKLQISVASAAVDGTKGVRITNPAGTIVMLECGSGGDSFVGTESGSTFNIRTNNAINATFLTNGNVGIGETSPTQRLHLKGSSTTYALAETTGTGTSSGFRMKAGAGTDFTLYTTQGGNQFGIYNNTTSTQPLTIDSSGNITNTRSIATAFSGTNSATWTNGLVFYNSATAATGNASLISFTGPSNVNAVYGVVQNASGYGDFVWAGYAGSFSEKMRLDSSGNLLVGQTSGTSYKLSLKTSSASQSAIGTAGTSGDTAFQSILITKFDNDSTTSQNFIQFQINDGGANCGKITANGANTAAFGSTSDQRVKENIAELPSQLANIMALRPVEFDYLESYGGGHQIGFIAQEIQQVYPDVISTDDSSEKIMSITGWSKTEARLVKAIQEQQALITQLTARITALESA